MRIDGHDNVIQHSDQRRCLSCGKVWDANDPEPPTCERSSSDPTNRPDTSPQSLHPGDRSLSAPWRRYGRGRQRYK